MRTCRLLHYIIRTTRPRSTIPLVASACPAAPGSPPRIKRLINYRSSVTRNHNGTFMAQEPHEDPRQQIRQYKRTCLPSLTKTPGDHFDEHVAEAFRSLSEPLAKAGVSPVILWGDLSNSYYGVPTAEIVSLSVSLRGGSDSRLRCRLSTSLFLKDASIQPMQH